jgi:predicted transcriptional regulator
MVPTDVPTLPPAASADAAPTQQSPDQASLERLRARYPEFADEVIRLLVDSLLKGRGHFSGDLDVFLIFLAVATRTTEMPEARGVRFADVLEGKLEAYPVLRTNVALLAESLEVPRESVRRKVMALVERGWLARAGNRLVITPFASQQFTPVRDQIFAMMLRFHDLCEEHCGSCLAANAGSTVVPPTIEVLRARYAEFADKVVRRLVGFMHLARKHFSGDLDTFLIYAAVATRTAEGDGIKSLNFEDVLEGRLEAYPGLWTNVSTLAGSLGVPRESVRRKVAQLVELGYVDRADGRLVLRPIGTQRSTPLREQIFHMMLSFHGVVAEYARPAA